MQITVPDNSNPDFNNLYYIKKICNSKKNQEIMEQKQLYDYRNRILLNQTDLKNKTPETYTPKKLQ